MKENDIRKREILNRYLQLVKEDADTFFAPEDFVSISCPACGNSDYSFEFKKSGFTYVSCKTCHTLFANPRPNMLRLKEFYAHSVSSKFWVNEFFKPFAEIRREKIFRPRAEYVQGLFHQLKGRVIGDIGGGFGLFLEEVRKLFPENLFIVIEPSIEMTELCRNKNFEVIPDSLENVESKYNSSFFFLTSFELLEHLGEPKKFLEKVYTLLQPEGYLLLTTLNGEGFDIQILWEQSKSVSPPHHLNFFNPQSISLLLGKCNFEVIEISTPGELDWDILEKAYKEEGVDIGRPWKLIADKGNQETKEALQGWIRKHQLSSHMQILAKKGK